MTKKTINYTKMYDFKRENDNFPSKIEELYKYILKDQRKKKIKKLNENNIQTDLG